MHLLPVTTGLLGRGDDLAAAIASCFTLQDGDIVVVSSKAVTMTESGSSNLALLSVTPEASTLSSFSTLDASFVQFILEETKRLGGEITGVSPFVILTSLQPSGIKKGCILCPNAGADRSNVEAGHAIGWPKDSAASAKALRSSLEKHAGVRIAVIVSDSCCRPSRQGVTAFALTVCGIDPMKNEVGNADLHGNPLHMTQEAVADQLATAANALMGNAAQATPAAVIRDHGLPLSDFCGWVDGIPAEHDMFQDTLGWKQQA